MSDRHALYPGTFDPTTFGHLDVLKRALRIFDRVTVAVAAGGRATLLDHETRIAAAREAAVSLDAGDRVRVIGFEGLLVETARREGATAVVRGLRGVVDLEHEQGMAAMNEALDPDFEVVVLFARAAFAHLSASLVRDVARCGGPLDEFVPPASAAALRTQFTG